MSTYPTDNGSMFPPLPSERLTAVEYRLHRVRGEASAKTLDVLTQLESLRIALIEEYNFRRSDVDFLSLIEQALDRMGVPARPTDDQEPKV